MVGIIGAMKIEIETIEATMTAKREKTVAGTRFVEGLIGGKPAVAAVCGIGKVAAALCTQAMIMEYAPDCIINSGVAGSLSPDINTCDVVVADTLVQHDMDTTPIGDPAGYIHSLKTVSLAADEKITRLLFECASAYAKAKVETGRIASGDQFIASAEQKNRIVSLFGAKACEMEGAAIAQACLTAGVPFGVLRAISDSADGSSPVAYTEFLPEAADIASKTMIDFVSKYEK